MRYLQPTLPLDFTGQDRPGQQGAISNSLNSVAAQDRAFHDWYRFVLSFPPHLVRDYLQDFGLAENSTVLDPFCGTGTTVVEAKLSHMRGVGLEANPFPQFAAMIKTSWDLDPGLLVEGCQQVAHAALATLHSQGIDDARPQSAAQTGIPLRALPAEAEALLIKNSISPLPLHKTLVLLDHLNGHAGKPFHPYGLLALGSALVGGIGNLRFGPEVGVGRLKEDAPVIALWLAEVRRMAADLQRVRDQEFPEAIVHLADAREVTGYVTPASVDAVITSPPYPNEKDYTRTTRLESVLLGFYSNKDELRTLKRRLLRSNTRGVYKADDDDRWVKNHPEVQRLAARIEERRIALGKTSGFERLYGRVTRLYFGGMARHFTELRTVLKPGAQLAYVVGDQASYLQVMIRTGQLLADIAQAVGYELVRIDLFRTRFATATQEDLREEVVVLRWPGPK